MKDHKNKRFQCSLNFLTIYEFEGDAMLNQIVVGDETWVSHVMSVSKQQSIEWTHTLSCKVQCQTDFGPDQVHSICVMRESWWSVDCLHAMRYHRECGSLGPNFVKAMQTDWKQKTACWRYFAFPWQCKTSLCSSHLRFVGIGFFWLGSFGRLPLPYIPCLMVTTFLFFHYLKHHLESKH